MATVGCGLVICWLIALRVVERRHALFVVVLLAIYPIFNFKGFKYNPDLLQLVTLPLVVLAYLHAFERRTARAGLWLGLAGALALMTKYWAITMVGAIGIAALIHPDRWLFLRSPAPWVAIATLVVAEMLAASVVAERGRFRSAGLCQGRLCPDQHIGKSSSGSRLSGPKYCAPCLTDRVGSSCAHQSTTAGELNARSNRARWVRPRERDASGKYLAYPSRCYDGSAVRRLHFHRLHEN